MRSRTESRALFGKAMIALWLGVNFVQIVCGWSNPEGVDQIDQVAHSSMGGRRLLAPTIAGF